MGGKWKVTFTTPMGPAEMNFDLTAAGDAITGTCETQFGTSDVTGTASGEEVELTTSVTGPQGPIELTFKGQNKGGEYNGDVQLGAFGGAPFTGAPA